MSASDQGKAPVQARLFTLAPGEAIPRHYHRQSTDHYFVLEGVLSISTHAPILRQLALGRITLRWGQDRIIGVSCRAAAEERRAIGNI